MVNDDSLQRFIDAELIEANAEREKTHEPSGLLSASMLYQPLRFQIMKNIGVPKKPMEPYLLGKFRRGNDCEDYLAERMEVAKVLIERQKPVEYRNTIGFVDAVVDSDKLLFKKGIMPHEIKSVTNAKLKYYDKGEVDYHYKLQGGFYGIAMKSEYYAIDVISAEDLRVRTYIFATKDIAPEIEKIITDYDTAMALWKEKKVLPAFVPNPNVPWTSNLQYAPFTEDWINLSDAEMVKRLEAK